MLQLEAAYNSVKSLRLTFLRKSAAFVTTITTITSIADAATAVTTATNAVIKRDGIGVLVCSDYPLRMLAELVTFSLTEVFRNLIIVFRRICCRFRSVASQYVAYVSYLNIAVTGH